LPSSKFLRYEIPYQLNTMAKQIGVDVNEKELLLKPSDLSRRLIIYVTRILSVTSKT